LQQWKTFKYLKPSLYSVLVACGGFLNDKLRDKQIEICSPILPPLLRDLLVCSSDQVSAWPPGS
jgi:hypothetical protein